MSQRIAVGDFIAFKNHNNEIYSGEVLRVLGNLIHMWRVFNHNTVTRLETPLVFYFEEVLDTTRLRPAPLLNESHTNGVGPSDLLVDRECRMPLELYERLNDMTLNYIYISLPHSEYTRAVGVLDRAEVIGLAGLGRINSNDNNKISVIVCCTLRQVFIFDIQCLPNMTALLNVLSSKHIRKLIYEGSALFQYLFNQHKVAISNFIDLQMTEKMLYRNISVKMRYKSLSECLAVHVLFPSCILEEATTLAADCQLWQLKRPLQKVHLVRAAQLVVYLPFLYDYFVRNLVHLNNKNHFDAASVYNGIFGQ